MAKTNDSKKKLIEKFQNASQAYGVFHTVCSVLAIYASIRCNRGFRLGPFMLAICCPFFYLIYIAATKGLTFCAGDIRAPV